MKLDAHALCRHSQAVEFRIGIKSKGGKILSAESFQVGFYTATAEKCNTVIQNFFFSFFLSCFFNKSNASWAKFVMVCDVTNQTETS